MKVVRAKFRVASITESAHWDKTKGNIKTIELNPVMDGSDENKAFYAATPSGSIKLGTVNGDAAAEFTIGAEFYVEFTRAEG